MLRRNPRHVCHTRKYSKHNLQDQLKNTIEKSIPIDLFTGNVGIQLVCSE